MQMYEAFSYNSKRSKRNIVTYTMRSTAGMMSPGLVAYVKMFPTKAGRSCSMVCMMMSYIFSWPLVTNRDPNPAWRSHIRYTDIYFIDM